MFGALPGGPELLIIFLLVPVGIGLFVYNDAKRHGLDYAPAWALGVVALFFAGFFPSLLALTAYFYVREKGGL